MEIILNESGSRKGIDSNTDLTLGEDNEVQSVLDESIPTKFRQQTQYHENGCIWLSIYLLVHLVDKEIADTMIEIYVKNQEKF